MGEAETMGVAGKALKEGREWDVINKERGERKSVNEEMKMREWT